ncbi:MAG: hypothetical protein GWP32_05870 [Bacteroidetes bacterium]|nr:hypothetical protein [Bacteroidota bacterium]
MKTLHNTKNCNYRRFLHTKLKHGKISGKFYKFICRNYPYRVTTSIVQICVREVLDGKMTENKAIAKMQDNDLELKRQAEMYKSNIECLNKISEKKTAKKFTTEEDVGRDIVSRIAKISNREKQEYLEFIKNKFGANKISRKVLDHAVLFIKKCMKENLYLPMRFKTSLYRIFTCEKFEISLYEKKFFLYFKCALSKTHKYSIYKQLNK